MTLGQPSTGRDLKRRTLLLGLAMLGGLLLLTGRLYRLQVIRGDEYAAKSVANFVKEIRIRADRGIIKDRRGEILVDSRPSFDVFVTPAFCEHCTEEVLPRLAGWLGWDDVARAHVEGLVHAARKNAPFQPVPVQLDLTRDELDTLAAHKTELPGVDWPAVPHRHYRAGAVLSHVVGYMNEISQEELDRVPAGTSYALGDFVGRRGVERYFERELRGADGSRQEVVNARGETIQELNDLLVGRTPVQPQPGDSVVLSLDMRLQEEAERAFPGVAGAVVVMDVRTGFILAVVSRPGFDPNLLTGRVTAAQMTEMARDPLQPMIFRPTQQHYSPGSTFKVVTILAALQRHVISATGTVTCSGGYSLGARRWRCMGQHGPMDAHHALQRSCDTFFYRMGDLLGLDPIADMGRSLGLGVPTGVAVVAEVPGIMPDSAYHDRVTPGGYTKAWPSTAPSARATSTSPRCSWQWSTPAVANGGWCSALSWCGESRAQTERRARNFSLRWCAKWTSTRAPPPGPRRADRGGERAGWHCLPVAPCRHQVRRKDGHRAGGHAGKGPPQGAGDDVLAARSRLVRGHRPSGGARNCRGGAQRAWRPRRVRSCPHRGGHHPKILRAQTQRCERQHRRLHLAARRCPCRRALPPRSRPSRRRQPHRHRPEETHAAVRRDRRRGWRGVPVPESP